jgi:hypothetical protein
MLLANQLPQPVDQPADIMDICATLYRMAQRHVPNSAANDVIQLAQITKMLRDMDIPAKLASRFKASSADYTPTLFKHSLEYRMLKARYTAALSTIADMGSKNAKKHKDEFHAGIQVGLRRAAATAIMFLRDLDNTSLAPEDNIKPENTGGKRNDHNQFVR